LRAIFFGPHWPAKYTHAIFYRTFSTLTSNEKNI
jgi:hypothetical protein